jgi:signal transduction histidine kinase
MNFCRAVFFFLLFLPTQPAKAQVWPADLVEDSVIKSQWQQFSDLLIKPGSYHYGILRNNKWVSTILQNPSNQPFTFNLRFHNPHINQLAVYKNHALKPTVVTGDWYAFSERPIAFRDFVIPIQVAPHTTDSVLIFLNKRGESLSISLDIISTKQLEGIIRVNYLWVGALLCFSFLIVLLSLYVGVSFKEPLYLSFALYWLLSMAWLLNNAGLFYQYCWPDAPLWHFKSRTVFSSFSLSAYLLYLILFFRSKIRIVDKIVFSLFVLFLLVKLYGILTAPSVEFKLPLKFSFVVVSAVGLFAFLLYLFYFLLLTNKGKFTCRFQLAAFIMYCLMVLQEVFLQFGFSYVPLSGITDLIPFLFFIAQFLLIIVGLVIQFSIRMKDAMLQALFSVRADERALCVQYFQMQESERSRIGRDVHDQLGGLLVSIKLSLSNLKLRFIDQHLHRELDRVRVIVDSSINQLHQVVHDLVPPTISTDNFKDHIIERIRLFEENSGIHFDFKTAFDRTLPKSVLLHLYRIICELINNSIQHAQCTNVVIDCTLHANRLVLLYTDNGQGFQKERHTHGNGLYNIEKRVSLLKGQVKLTSTNEGVNCLIETDITQYHETDAVSL